MNTKNSSFILLFIIASTSVFAQKKIKDPYLHKKTYIVEVTITGGKKEKIFAEEINFASGKIKTKNLALEEHFLTGDYEVSKVDSSGEAWSIDFKGACKNDKEDYIIIEGTVFGEMIDGTIRWETKKKKVKSEMTFTGSLKVKGQKTPPANTKTSSGAKSSGSKSSKPVDKKEEEKKLKEEEELDKEILDDDL